MVISTVNISIIHAKTRVVPRVKVYACVKLYLSGTVWLAMSAARFLLANCSYELCGQDLANVVTMKPVLDAAGYTSGVSHKLLHKSQHYRERSG